MNPWDRRPDESAKAYAAFEVYRDLGAARSIDKAWRHHVTEDVRAAALQAGLTLPDAAVAAEAKAAQLRSKAAPGHWNTWCHQFTWTERVSAWDSHLVQLRVKEREREALNELESYRIRRKRRAVELEDAAGKILKMGLERMAAFTAKDLEKLTPGRVAQVARAAAALYDVASDMEGSALAVGELLQVLDPEGGPQGSPD